MKNGNREHVASILRGVLSLGRRLRAERPQGSISLSAISILGTLKRLGPTAATRLAAEEGLRPQSLTRMIMGLERKGLISRTQSNADRREILIALTEKGRRVLVEDMNTRRAWLEAAIAAALTESERNVLFAACEIMRKLAFHDGPTAGGSMPSSAVRTGSRHKGRRTGAGLRATASRNA